MSDAARPATTSATVTHEAGTVSTPVDTHAVRRLRIALGANELFSATTGATALIAASPLGRFFDIDDVMVRVIGLALVVFAAALVVIRRIADHAVLRAWAIAVSIADIAWVIGTIVVIASGAVSSGGAILLAAIALVVADLAAAQLYYRARSC
ncbi:MAG: hypothetical protein AAGA42_13815 [Actinomycetota bacterium]